MTALKQSPGNSCRAYRKLKSHPTVQQFDFKSNVKPAACIVKVGSKQAKAPATSHFPLMPLLPPH